MELFDTSPAHIPSTLLPPEWNAHCPSNNLFQDSILSLCNVKNLTKSATNSHIPHSIPLSTGSKLIQLDYIIHIQ